MKKYNHIDLRWKTKRIGDILSLEYGKPLPKSERDDDGKYAVYGANGIKTRSNKFYVDQPAIIVGRKGSAGEITLTNEPFWPLDVTYFVSYDSKLYDLKFLYYFLVNQGLQKLAKGVKPGINRNDVYKLKVKVPPIEQQKRIVKILDDAFEKLEIAEKNTENNLVNAKELFKSFQKRIFDDGQDRWKKRKLTEISENLDNKRIPITKRDRKKGNYPYYGASGIVDYVNDYIFDEDLLLISEDGANLLARTYPIAFSVTGKIWVNNHAHVIRFNDKKIQLFVEYYLNYLNLENFISGMAQPKLNQGKLNSISIYLPPENEIQKIINQFIDLKTNIKKIENIYQNKLIKFDELKKSVLQKAFSGEM